MSDRGSRGDRNRSDYRSGRDERDRYGKDQRNRRDYRARDHDKERDRDNDRRQRSRSPRDRRDRDRSRDRRDRRRDYDRDRPRDRDGGRDNHRREESPSEGARSDRRRDRAGDSYRDSTRKDRRRSEEPPKSPIGRGLNTEHESPLPSRPKDNSTSRGGSGTPLSFQVKKQDDGGKSRGRSGDQSPERGRRHKVQDEAHHDDSARSDGEAMDEDDDLEVEDDGLAAMQAMMGIGGFGSTKNTKVVGNNIGAVRKEKKTEYRQYMNRVGGFNRPLSPGR